jgi:lysophospholipase L1-like esterase
MRLVTLVACAALSWPIDAAAADFVAARPAPRVEYPQQRLIDITAYLKNATDLSGVRLLFVGDSITDFFSMGANPWLPGKVGGKAVWDETFGPGHPHNLALNLGISGDRTEWLLYRLQPQAAGGLGELDSPDLKPQFIMLMAGINNTYAAETPLVDSVFAGVRALVDAVHAAKPQATVVLESLLPSNEEWRNRDAVIPVNRRLEQLTRSMPYENFVEYLDLYPLFVDAAGQQRVELFMDGLHPDEAGYRIWRDALVALLDSKRAAMR